MVSYSQYELLTWDKIYSSGKLDARDDTVEGLAEKMKWALANPELFACWPLNYNLPKHQGYWLRLMMENPSLLLISCVDHGKTTSAVNIFTLWKLARNRNLRIALIGYNDDVLLGALRNIQYQIENNENLHLFGLRPDTGQKKWQEDRCYIERDDTKLKDPTYIVLGRGSTIENRRVDLAICDDLINLRDYIKSRKIHNRLQTWYLEQLVPRFRTTEIKMIGSYQADDDFYTWLETGEIEEGEKVATETRIVAFSSLVERGCEFMVRDSDQPVIDSKPYIDLSRVFNDEKYPLELEALWPEEWPVNKLIARLKTIGRRAAGRKYLALKVADTGYYFKIADVNLCKNESLSVHESPEKLPAGMRVFMGLDPSTGEGNAWTCLFVLGITEIAHYLLKYYRARLRYPEIRDLVWEKNQLWHPEIIAVENNACQIWLMQDLDSQAKYKLLPIASLYTGVKKWEPEEGLPYLTTLMQNRLMNLPWATSKDRYEMEAYIDELRYFPSGKSSDIIMAWYLSERAALMKKDVKTESYASPFSFRERRRSIQRLPVAPAPIADTPIRILI